MSEVNTNVINENSVILVLTLGKPGNRSKVKQAAVTVTPNTEGGPSTTTPDQSMLHVLKDKLDSRELEAIGQLYGRVRRYADSESLPTRTLKNGMYRIAAPRITRVNARLAAFNEELHDLVAAFKLVYTDQVIEAGLRLGEKLFNPLDYPEVEELDALFTFTYDYLVYESPREVLGRLDQQLLAQQEERIRLQLADDVAQIRLGLAHALQEPINYLMELLVPTDGKQKKVKDSAIEKFNKAFRSYMENNITGDDQLTQLMNRAHAVVNGATPDDLNSNENIKNLITNNLKAIKATLDELVVERSERTFYIERDDDDSDTVEHAA